MLLICGSSVVILLLILLTLRNKREMAAFLTWFVGSMTTRLFIGSQETKENPSNEKKEPELKTIPDIPKSKSKSKQKIKNEEPTFSTDLSTPIEKVIEETITESVIQHQGGVKKKIKTNKTRKEKLKKQQPENSGVKSYIANSNSTSKTEKNGNQTSRDDIEVFEDKSAVSFTPVRDKNKKGKNPTEKCGDEALRTIVAKSVRKSKEHSDIIDHYKVRKSPKHQAVIEALPAVTRRFSDSYEKVQNFVVVNRLEEKPLESEFVWKESKKVSSSISYASVVLNNYQNSEEKPNSYEIVDKEDLLGGKVTSLDLSKSSSDSAEYLDTSELHEPYQKSNDSNVDQDSSSSESIETLDNSDLQESVINLEESADFSNTSHGTVLNLLHSELSKSSSESIEVLEHFCDAEEHQSNLETNQEVNGTSEVVVSSISDSNKVEQNIVDDFLVTESIISDFTHNTSEKALTSSNFRENSSQVDIESVSSRDFVNFDIKSYQSTKDIVVQDQVITTDNSLSPESQDTSENSVKGSEDTGKGKRHTDSCGSLKRENSIKLNLEIMKQIRVLTLNDKEHQQSTLYRLEKKWTLQFRIGPSLFGRKVFLYCNYPPAGTSFVRDKYYLIPWILDEGCKNADDTAAFANIPVNIAGSFHYFFTFSESGDSTREGSGYFLVDPIIKYGNNEELPLDCIQCQTVLAKCLGSFSSWEKKLKVAKESGYNMIHFTPIQELGESNSSYSLSEQLKINPVFKKTNSVLPTFQEVEAFTEKLRKEWKMCSICDIVLNHTANESLWIQQHPEVTYNCVNCPYMRPAYLLDAAFHTFSMDVKNGLYEEKGIPLRVNSEEHLNAIRYHFRQSVLEPLNIPEMFICDVNNIVREFLTLARNSSPTTRNPTQVKTVELQLLQDPEYRRLAASIDKNLALELYNIYRNDTFDEESRLKKCSEDLKKKLEELNKAVIDEVNGHLNVALENVIAGIRYYWVQADGPKFEEITIKTPLVYRYFTDFGKPKSLEEHEAIMYSPNGRFLMAHNGWVMNSDPLKNFAASDSKVYIRRELIAWGDSVKLRYGDKPEDCPFLWDHMRKYVEETARIFDGVRLDNCHSTPIPVAEYLLDCARRVRPDLYVVAELFTNSDMVDNIFVNRLGITSLIREAMSAWDSHEEGRLVYRYGGYPVGAFYQPSVRPLVPSVAHALFLDLTHDNPSPVEKRSVFDLLPNTALVNMACCASGSNRGYDELVPHHIHVVDENREYAEWSDTKLGVDNVKLVSEKSGLISAKRAINNLHFTLGKEGYNQVYVDQMDADIVAVTRHCPNTHQSYILISFTAFGQPAEDAGNYQRGIKPLRFEGVLDEIVLEATLSHVEFKNGGSKFKKFQQFVKDPKCINGLSEYEVAVKQHIPVQESDVFEMVDSGAANVTQLNFKNFKPGSIVVVKTSLPAQMKQAVDSVRLLINEFSKSGDSELYRIVSKMSLADLNRAIFRCDKEERDEGYGFDTYNIPNFGFMVYAGLQGMISLLANIRPNNDLGHPLCGNLRDGNWMIDYIWRRLKFDTGTKDLGVWIEKNSNTLTELPRYLIPCYFDVIVTGIYIQLVEHSYELMSSFVKHGSTFVRGLSLGSVQMAAYIKTADLPVLSPNLAPPKPPFKTNDNGEEIQACVTLSAGLPHFATGYMRNWGRDTFIALRGLFIITGRYQEAREHILGYGACLRHGLIPNLLDGGRNPRFNCRDAVWWWLHCIKEYVEESPNGISILSDKVSRIFPKDDSTNQAAGTVDQPLHEVMQEALNVHFQGLVFRERNAGRQIDEHMTDHGFNNQIGIHPETGFVFGGNQWNCGTWMDKMGSSDKAGNRGKPATPRDGSAVELIGLSKAVVTWLDKLYNQKQYPYSGVQRTHKNGSVTKWSFKEWSNKIQANFEKHFWVDSTPTDGEIRPDLINKRGIYKDSYGSSQGFPDFQLRCNFPIAMAVAPELFTPERAWKALSQAEKYLLGPLGMKTLDPQDWAYKGDYDNSNDSNDASVANGFNYHQGPEWVWPVGFFLRAKLQFAAKNGALRETLSNTKLILSKHFVELQTSPWRGLPELTNSSGAYCKDSSRTQAWSMSCILEVLYDLQRMESQLPLVN